MYPSLFVSGMVGMDTLESRRKLLIMVHYYQLLHYKVDNPCVLEQMGLHVPAPRTSVPGRGGGGAVEPRRRPRPFARSAARTRRGDNAPTRRALLLLNNLYAQVPDADIFHDSIGVFVRRVRLCLDNCSTI